MTLTLLVAIYLLVGFGVAWFQKVENLVTVVTSIVTWPLVFIKNFKI